LSRGSLPATAFLADDGDYFHKFSPSMV